MLSFLSKTLNNFFGEKELSREFFTLRRSEVKLSNDHSSICFRLELDWRWHFWCGLGILVVSIPFLTNFQISAIAVDPTFENLILGLVLLLVITPTALLALWLGLNVPLSKDEPLFTSSKHPNKVFRNIFALLIVAVCACCCLNVLRSVLEVSPSELLPASTSCDPINFQAFNTCIGLQLRSWMVIASICAVLWGALYCHSRFAERFTLTVLTDVYHSLPKEAKHQIDLALPSARVKPNPTWEWRHVIDLPYAFYLNAISLAIFKAPREKSAFRHNLGFVVWYLAPVYIPLIALLIAPFSMEWVKPQNCPIEPKQGDFFCGGKVVQLCYAEAMILWAVWATTYYLMLGKKHFLRQENPQPIYALAAFGLLKDSSLVEMSRYFENNGFAIAALFILSIMPIYFDYLGLFK